MLRTSYHFNEYGAGPAKTFKGFIILPEQPYKDPCRWKASRYFSMHQKYYEGLSQMGFVNICNALQFGKEKNWTTIWTYNNVSL